MRKTVDKQAVRNHCLESEPEAVSGSECMCDSRLDVKECPSISCYLYPYRLFKGGKVGRIIIKNQCLHCNGVEKDKDNRLVREGKDWAINEVKKCTDTNCHLYAYR